MSGLETSRVWRTATRTVARNIEPTHNDKSEKEIMFHLKKGARLAQISLVLLAALAVSFAAMAALAGPVQAEILRVTNKNDSGSGSLRAGYRYRQQQPPG